MPLVPPSNRREKLYICGPAGGGKTTTALSIAYWAFQSKDPRKFLFLDFDDSLGDLLLDERYKGMHEADGGNCYLFTPDRKWEEWRAMMDKVLGMAERGDFIVGDMIGRGWRLVQDWEARVARDTTRNQTILDAAKGGAKGWDLFRETNWAVVNSEWEDFIQPSLLSSEANLLFTTEQQDIGGEAKRGEAADTSNMRREFGRYVPKGQKELPFQVRSVLRVDRLARGRVLFTLKDRARKELDGETMPDFFLTYMKEIAGWGVADAT